MEEGRIQGISAGTLKMIAAVTMLIDHVGAVILGRYLLIGGYREDTLLYSVYMAVRMVGRIAFPIYCFLLVEGMKHTRDVKKYACRMAVFALLSEIPFDLALSAKVMDVTYQNVFFTLLTGVLTMSAFAYVREHITGKVLRVLLYGAAMLAGMAAAEFLRADYGATGVFCILVLYLLRNQKSLQMLGGCVVFLWETTAPFAFIPIAFYNGRRGVRLKYFFYAFYPVHLLILYLICVVLGISSYPAV